MNDICHIVRGFNGEKSDIIGVFFDDIEAKGVRELFSSQYERFEIDAWVIKGDAIFDTYKLTKPSLYEVGATVLYKDDDGLRLMGSVVWSDGNQRMGFQNVSYRVEHATGVEYVLGSDIIGQITKKEVAKSED